MPKHPHPIATLALATTALLWGWLAATARAADAPKTARPATPAKPATQPPKPAATAQERADKAKGMALATETVQRATEAQLQLADRVLTGDAACEFEQTVNLQRISGQPGYFRLRFKKASYTVVPEETSTGAVRLEDRKAGIVWIQIPSKSMLLNAKIGQRLVDNCLHAEQRAAVAAAAAAASATAAGAKP
ncbi:MAG: hypothetical protein HS128_08645 [Ideonella sp.]|nr:hypothetical protein [Ideonella sp.]MCC7457844.1 hypothetical protein [Nitrospira sp.]